ncbi:Uncharacterized protein SCF082_LOCUS29783, partial [Durusdinium trenchii]
VVPLGSTCLVARHLQKNKGLRVCKFPFDWMYSTPYLVRHALTDNFKVYQMNPKSDAGKGSKGSRNNRKVVFPHHQLWSGSPQCKELRKSFLRAAQRCRQVLRAPKGAKGPKGARTLFVCKCPIPEEGGPELCSRAEILYCKGDNTGLVFPEDEDMLAFHNIITESGQRNFVCSEPLRVKYCAGTYCYTPAFSRKVRMRMPHCAFPRKVSSACF